MTLPVHFKSPGKMPGGPKIFYLERRNKNHLFWQLALRQNTTAVRSGDVGGSFQEYPRQEHSSARAAYNFALQELRKKKKQGFEDVRNVTRENKPTGIGGQPLENEPFTRIKGYHGNKQKLPTKRRVEQILDEDEDMHSSNDTDSISSSTSSVSGQPPEKRGKYGGVSPLNRKGGGPLGRCARKESTMEAAPSPSTALLSRVSTTYFLRHRLKNAKLQKVETVVMEPEDTRKLSRMETSTRWTNWRFGERLKSQESTVPDGQGNPQPKLKKGKTKNLQWENDKTINVPLGGRVSLLKKDTTTTSLRGLFGGVDLVDTATLDLAEPGEDFVDGATVRSSLKRKATTPLSPTVEKTPGRKSLRKGMLKKVTIVTPEEAEEQSARMKRQSTVLVDDPALTPQPTSSRVLPSAKRMCVPRGMTRQNTILGAGEVYVPAKDDWPVELKSAPEVWVVPLETREGEKKGQKLVGKSVFVDSQHCLIALDDATVVELDSTVTPVRTYCLPATANVLHPAAGTAVYAGCDDGGLYTAVYAGCDDGGLYKFQQDKKSATLVLHIKGFGQLLSLGVYNQRVAISDEQGNIALVNPDGTAAWRKKSPGDFGWMAKVDDTGVYHGCSKGITKYSLLDGTRIWHHDTANSMMDGAMTKDALYLAVGATVVKVDKVTSKVVQTYQKGKSLTAVVHCCAVGCGLVFCGGNKIVCYDEVTGDIVYKVKMDFKPIHMQYFSGRLFCVGMGSMSVLDFTRETITLLKTGGKLTPTIVNPDPAAATQDASVKSVNAPPTMTTRNLGKSAAGTEPAASKGVVVQCVYAKPAGARGGGGGRHKARRGELVVRALSTGYNKSWDVQLPSNLCCDGAKYVVDDLKPNPKGNFYRVYGEIKPVYLPDTP